MVSPCHTCHSFPSLFFAKAACYFQHRQQFIFPGELTVPEHRAALLLFSHRCSTLQSIQFPALSVLCMFAFRVVAGSAVVSKVCQQWDCMLRLNSFLIPSAGGSGKMHGQSCSVRGGP